MLTPCSRPWSFCRRFRGRFEPKSRPLCVDNSLPLGNMFGNARFAGLAYSIAFLFMDSIIFLGESRQVHTLKVQVRRCCHLQMSVWEGRRESINEEFEFKVQEDINNGQRSTDVKGPNSKLLKLGRVGSCPLAFRFSILTDCFFFEGVSRKSAV